MGMTPGPWSRAAADGLPTYEGAPCPDCGCRVRTTNYKQCVNKCHLKRLREYRRKRREMIAITRFVKRRPPEEAWKMLRPDFNSQNIEVRYH